MEVGNLKVDWSSSLLYDRLPRKMQRLGPFAGHMRLESRFAAGFEGGPAVHPQWPWLSEGRSRKGPPLRAHLE
jgi:hypothetical protein